MTHYLRRILLLAVAVQLQACGGGDGASGSGANAVTGSNPIMVYQGCTESYCEHRIESGNSACDACTSACIGASYNCNISSACQVSCGSTTCSETEKKMCYSASFKVSLPTDKSQKLEDACNRAGAHVRDCGYETKLTASRCAEVAEMERPEFTTNYDCMTALSCKDLLSSSAMATCAPPSSTLGDELCKKHEDSCGYACPDWVKPKINDEGTWLRPELVEAGRFCASQDDCTISSACLNAWKAMIGAE